MIDIILFVTDKSTGEDRAIGATIPETSDDEREVAILMLNGSTRWAFSGWDYDYARGDSLPPRKETNG